MIGIFDDAGARLAVTLPGITLNNPADDPLDTFEINGVVTTSQIDTAIDSNPSKTGAIISPARRIIYLVRVDGTIRAPSLAKLFDKGVLLASALDPDFLSRQNPSTNGFVDMDFSVPTTDTTEYPTGLVPSRYRVRPRNTVVPADSMYTGTSAFFAAEFLLRDPRRVYQTLESRVGAGTVDNEGNTYAGVVVSIAMSGAGQAGYVVDLNGDGVTGPTLDLSATLNGDVIVIDMDAGTVTKNGVDAITLMTSGTFFDIPPGSSTIGITNGTNATTTIQWRRSWTI